ncbi:MAG: hypothetical protein K2Q19_08800 [Rhodocyclaceae bacterium]|nr:hypothetical protein [Rhodocyclaceae bacterium]
MGERKSKPTPWASSGRYSIRSIEGGGSFNLGTSFNDGDYGIHRLALPMLSGITLTGDYATLDTKPEIPEVDTGYHALGNPLTDSSKPDPGREDALYGGADLGTAANDEWLWRVA